MREREYERETIRERESVCVCVRERERESSGVRLCGMRFSLFYFLRNLSSVQCD